LLHPASVLTDELLYAQPTLITERAWSSLKALSQDQIAQFMSLLSSSLFGS
jgi:hypothetical protein